VPCCAPDSVSKIPRERYSASALHSGSPRQVPSVCTCLARSSRGISARWLGCEPFISIARGDRHVIVPHILIPGGFMVLWRGHAIACVYRFHRRCKGFDEFVSRQGEVHGQFVDVLEMLFGTTRTLP
jgi:hypothetical protein